MLRQGGSNILISTVHLLTLISWFVTARNTYYPLLLWRSIYQSAYSLGMSKTTLFGNHNTFRFSIVFDVSFTVVR